MSAFIAPGTAVNVVDIVTAELFKRLHGNTTLSCRRLRQLEKMVSDMQGLTTERAMSEL